MNNVFSFGDQKEFNMIPNAKIKTFPHHKYQFGRFNYLKMTSIYGANGAGKSNLIKAVALLKTKVTNPEMSYAHVNSEFKLKRDSDNLPQIFVVEFIEQNTAFYYALEINHGSVSTEQLYESGLGVKKDKLLFERKTNNNKVTSIVFSDKFEKDERSQLLKSVLIEDFVKPNEPILKLLSNRENEHLSIVKKAYNWFNNTLEVLMPNTKPFVLPLRIDADSELKNYAEDIMCSFHVGITALKTEKKQVKELYENDQSGLEMIVNKFKASPENGLVLKRLHGVDELVLVKEKDEVFAKQLKLEHQGLGDIKVDFYLSDESDGTVRLLDLIPAFKDIISRTKVLIIDEIERSIHPLLIKELVKKFSFDDNSKGQLIFTTHESNLLDQEIFRQDEIWFAEKDKYGSTDLYSLSDFKEHKTIDIKKGYLTGRYGSVPFLANLRDLNWHKYDTEE